MTNQDKTLAFMRQYGSITQQDALRFQPHGCTRLADVIFKLRNQGYDIVTKTETKKYEDGSSVTYARYILREG